MTSFCCKLCSSGFTRSFLVYLLPGSSWLTMSSSKPVNSDRIMSEGIAAIQALKNVGLLDAVLERVNPSNVAASSNAGGMSDASKRRISHPDEDFITEAAIRHDVEEAMMERAIARFNGDQSPIAPEATSFTVVSESSAWIPAEPMGQLPSDMDSLSEWGRTICELPKVKALKMSYAELLSKAEDGDTAMANYLDWVRTYRGPSVRTIGFGKYLVAMDELSGPKTYFPGSHFVRRLK